MQDLRGSLTTQARSVGPALFWTLLLTGGGIVGIGLLAGLAGIGFSDLSRDPLSVAGREFYVGALSNAGVLAWWTAAVLCLFSAAVLRRRGDRSRSSFLLVSGLITAWLTLDDFYQFHEEIVPVYLGLPETYVHIVYLTMMSSYLVVFRAILFSTEYLLLFASGGLFAISVIVDELIGQIQLKHLLEDGPKLLGIAVWLLYYSRVSMAWVSTEPQPATRPAPTNRTRRPALAGQH